MAVSTTSMSLSLSLNGNGALTKVGPVETVTSPLSFGSGGWDAMSFNLAFGTGNNQGNTWFSEERTLAAGASKDYDLAGGLVNSLGDTLTFTAVKLVLVAIDAPDGTKAVRVGPQGVANAWQGPWGGTGATNYTEVGNWLPVVNHPTTGYPVTSGTAEALRVNNPTGGGVTYRILIAGVA
jgi:hypothetical protein